MKQIGVGLWTGDPLIGAFAEEAWQTIERMRVQEERELAKKSPVERFFHLARQTWKQPKRYVPGWENDFVGHDVGVMHFRKLIRVEDNFPDLPDAADFLVFLKLLYVVDAHQGEGVGRSCLTEVTSIAERSGAAVFLYSLPFGFSKDGQSINAFTSLEELEQAMIHGWEVRYWRQNDRGSVRYFYESVGFQHCWLDSPLAPYVQINEDTGQVWRPNDYIYMPKTLDERYREQLADRLNKGLSQLVAG